MRNIRDPRQTRLFDPYEGVFSPAMRKTLDGGWQGVFRQVVLQHLPAPQLARNFHPTHGAPTKEMYSMAGLLLIKEFRNMTTEEAVVAYCTHLDVQYALNLPPAQAAVVLSQRTVERYSKLFLEDGLHWQAYEDLTRALIAHLELRTERQRVDSTHFLSDMALFGRTQLLGRTVKRFLVQVRRHDRADYDALPLALRERYEAPVGYLFGKVPKGEESRRKLRQDVAQDMYYLVKHFADHPTIPDRATYQMLRKVFEQQCEVEEETVKVKKHPGGDVIQNPSDPDATREGKKGAGYKMQVAETCSPENPVQLVVGLVVQTACEDDRDSMPAVLESLERTGAKPQVLLGDAHYGSQKDVDLCAQEGIDLQSPVPAEGAGGQPGDLIVDDFELDEQEQTVLKCPCGHEPVRSTFSAETGRTRTVMPGEACSGCPQQPHCPVNHLRGQWVLEFDGARRRRQARRRYQQSQEFKDAYRMRSGGESVNSGLKRKTGLGRVRSRGSPRVAYRGVLKVAGWNVLQAARAPRVRAARARKAAREAQQASFFAHFGLRGLFRALLDAFYLVHGTPRATRPAKLIAASA